MDVETLSRERQALTEKNVELALALDEAERRCAEIVRAHRQDRAQWSAREQELECHNAALSQQLEESESLRTQLEADLTSRAAQVRSLELELRTAIEKVAELRGELRLKAGSAEALHQQVIELKQGLARDLALPEQDRAADKLASLYHGVPGEVFAKVLQEVLGLPGRSLVEQLYQRCNLDFYTTHVEDLAMLVSKLQQMAIKLARTPEQAERIRLGLNRCRSFMALPEDAAPIQAAPVKRREYRPKPELMQLKAANQELGRRIEDGMKLVTLERYEQALKVFTELVPRYPECVEVHAGLFYAYAGFGCWRQAYEIGSKVLPAVSGEQRERFRKAYTRVVSELVDETRDPRQAKRWLLDLAELHHDAPRKALGFLRRASRIPETIEDEARIDSYLRELLPQVESGSAVDAVARIA